MSPFFELNFCSGDASGVASVVVVLMTLLNFLMAIFWLVVGWRGMRAHERLPEVLASSLRPPAPSDETRAP